MNDGQIEELTQSKQAGRFLMADADNPWIDRDFETQVREMAYFLWENDGRPHGREKQYWFTALDRCLRQREAGELLRKEPADGTTEQHVKNDAGLRPQRRSRKQPASRRSPLETEALKRH